MWLVFVAPSALAATALSLSRFACLWLPLSFTVYNISLVPLLTIIPVQKLTVSLSSLLGSICLYIVTSATRLASGFVHSKQLLATLLSFNMLV